MKIDYEDRLIAFIDILGWSEASKSMSAAHLNQILQPIIDRAAYYSQANKKRILHQHGDRTNPLLLDVEFCFFSDCFVISMPSYMGGRIFDFASDITRELLTQGFLVRGGISRGNLVHNGQIIYGPSLIDAYSIESKIAFHPRIYIDKLSIDSSLLVPQSAIIKDQLGDIVVDPFSMRGSGFDFNMLNQMFKLDLLLKTLKENLDPSIKESSVKDKWRYFLNFCSLSLSKFGVETEQYLERLSTIPNPTVP